jgi:hypothetical protein
MPNERNGEPTRRETPDEARRRVARAEAATTLGVPPGQTVRPADNAQPSVETQQQVADAIRRNQSAGVPMVPAVVVNQAQPPAPPLRRTEPVGDMRNAYSNGASRSDSAQPPPGPTPGSSANGQNRPSGRAPGGGSGGR